MAKTDAIPGGGSPMPMDRARNDGASVDAGLAFSDIDGYTHPRAASGTSIFDPVLCEIAYRWFCPPDGVVLDPFAGGSVRGVVASRLGRRYVGCELRPEQVAANREQGAEICGEPMPQWHERDSRDIAGLGVRADFVFSCPPYADLERYSDDPRDLSTMDYSAFLAAYRQIIGAACGMLRPDRFACFVVGDVRGPDGAYRNFVGDTIEAFRTAGLAYYNDIVLLTCVGSLPIRVAKQFVGSRKVGKTHQNVLVFLKGDARKAVAACGPVAVDAEALDAAEDPNADIDGNADPDGGAGLAPSEALQ